MEGAKFPSTFLPTPWLWLPGVRRAVQKLSDRAFPGREDAATSPETLHVSLFDDRPGASPCARKQPECAI